MNKSAWYFVAGQMNKSAWYFVTGQMNKSAWYFVTGQMQYEGCYKADGRSILEHHRRSDNGVNNANCVKACLLHVSNSVILDIATVKCVFM